MLRRVHRVHDVELVAYKLRVLPGTVAPGEATTAYTAKLGHMCGLFAKWGVSRDVRDALERLQGPNKDFETVEIDLGIANRSEEFE